MKSAINSRFHFGTRRKTKKWRNNMQEMSEIGLQDVECLKRRVQHLEEELSKVKMKMTGKKWL
jgi:hypothetical protein